MQQNVIKDYWNLVEKLHYCVGWLHDGLKRFIRVGMSPNQSVNQMNGITEMHHIHRKFDRNPIGAAYSDCDIRLESCDIYACCACRIFCQRRLLLLISTVPSASGYVAQTSTSIAIQSPHRFA
ncbi:hypothetical protein TNCV_2665921 [Trichonephila clavipes]|nr:hypothetical protein TNCV_2665921 [Trichonephila clavipes]